MRRVCALVLVVGTVVTGCQPLVAQKTTPDAQMKAQATKLHRAQSVVVPFTEHDGHKTVPLDVVAKKMGYTNVAFDPDTGVLQVGDTDVVLRIKSGSRLAEKAGGNVVLTDAPQTIGGHLHVPLSTLLDVFQEEMVYEIDPTGIRIVPSDGNVQKDTPLDDSFHFEEDASAVFAGQHDQPTATQGTATLRDIDMEALLAKASSYLGVPYLFGAQPYSVSKRFDCSSFTRHVFSLFGVPLPRTARDQATTGVTISRKQLQKGDLLFFYVPGRFKSNNIIGHVGIYVGNMQMIDANRSPKNGVQIRKINTPYWERVFLRAKRIAV
ncbi:MAG: C40 family peptidase [Paenibacillaceae bacterium]|nr:C40 family peptidase [Paenibacillaceae bacterium]